MSNKYCNLLDMKVIDQKIDEAMTNAMESGKEFGFNFCSENGRIIATEVEEGKKYSLGIDSKCPKGDIVGAFHVHTKVGKDAIPSPNDILKGITDDDITFFCIGAKLEGHNVVRCFTKGDLEKEMKNIFSEATILGIKEMSKSAKIISSRMTIKKDYLDSLSCQNIKNKIKKE